MDLDSLVTFTGSIDRVNCPRNPGAHAYFYYELDTGEMKEGHFPAVRSLCDGSFKSKFISAKAEVTYFGHSALSAKIDGADYLLLSQGIKDYEFGMKFLSISMLIISIGFYLQHRKSSRNKKNLDTDQIQKT